MGNQRDKKDKQRAEKIPTLLDLIREFLSGKKSKYQLSDSQAADLLKLQTDPEFAEQFSKDLNLGSSEELDNVLSRFLSEASNTPNYLDRLRERIRRGEIAEKLSAGFGSLVALAQLGVSSGQIARSNKMMRAIKRPGSPSIPGYDSALSDAISRAQRGTFDSARAVSPLLQKLEQQRLADIELAKRSSSGQSGSFQALSQAAANRAARSIPDIAPVIDAIRHRESERVNRLLEQRMAQRQADTAARLSLYNTDQLNYFRDLAAASQLGSTGRSNLMSSLSNLADTAAVLGSYMNKTRLSHLDQFEDDANKELAESRHKFNQTFNPTSVRPLPPLVDINELINRRQLISTTQPDQTYTPLLTEPRDLDLKYGLTSGYYRDAAQRLLGANGKPYRFYKDFPYLKPKYYEY